MIHFYNHSRLFVIGTNDHVFLPLLCSGLPLTIIYQHMCDEDTKCNRQVYHALRHASGQKLDNEGYVPP